MKKTTEEDLTRILLYWQGKLKLAHWDISIRFSTAKEMSQYSKLPANALNLNDPCTLTSIIWVLPENVREDDVFGKGLDMEQLIVHELLHLHFAQVRPSDKEELDIEEEQAIQCISRTILELKQEAKAEIKK